MRRPTLDTGRLVLTLPGPEAGERLAEYARANRDHLAPWSPPFPAGHFEADYWRDRLARDLEDFERGTAVRFVVFDRAAPRGPVVGTCGLSQIFRGPFLACYLGYALAHERQGRGLMREAVARTVRYAFEELELHRVMANYVPTNERSGRLLRALGFVVEGYARDYLFIGGAWRDHVLTSITNDRLGETRPG